MVTTNAIGFTDFQSGTFHLDEESATGTLAGFTSKWTGFVNTHYKKVPL